MEHLNFTQQVAASIWGMGLCMILHFLINSFPYIWVEELGNTAFWKKPIEEI